MIYVASGQFLFNNGSKLLAFNTEKVTQ